MRFENPEWLIGLIALPLLGFVAWLAWRNRGERWRKLVAPRLQSRLSLVRPPWIFFTSLGLALAGLGGLVITIAQPESGEEWIEVESEGRNILFCIDISRSMLAEDVKPNRLQASRAAALEILEQFPHDRVGVLLFSGETLVQSPLTLDHSFVEQTLSQLDPNDIPYGGSNLSGGVNAGIRLLSQTGQQSNIMVIFSDGEKSTEGLEEAAGEAAKEGIFIYALGMGTSEGSFIPDPTERDGKFRDRNGNLVLSKLDEEALVVLAERTEGVYSRGIGGSFLRKLDSALQEMDRFREEGKHQRVAKPAYKWFLFGGILLVMISIFVRCLPLPAVTAVAVLAVLTPRTEAGLIEDGRDALERGDQMEAHQYFREAAGETSGNRAAQLHMAAGSAAWRAKSWNAAAESFSEALESNDPEIQQKAHYALATSLFYLGVPLEGAERKKAWEGSVKHYEAALKINPEDQASRDNLESVRKMLQEKEKKEQQEQKQENSEKSDDQKEDPKDEQKDSQNDSKKPEEQPKPNEKQDPQPPNDQGESDQPKPGEEDPKKTEQPGDPNKEQDQPGEEGDPNKNGAQDPKAPQENGENPRENPGNEQNSENKQTGKTGEEKQSTENEPKDIRDAPANESKAERARRLLKQYADFGGKAPRRVRRPFNRAAHDW